MEKAGRAARQSCVERADKTAAVLPKDTCCGESTAGRAGDPAGTHKQSQLWSTPLHTETKLCIKMYTYGDISVATLALAVRHCRAELFSKQYAIKKMTHLLDGPVCSGIPITISTSQTRLKTTEGRLIQPPEHIRMSISTIWGLMTSHNEDSAHPFRGGGYPRQPPVVAGGRK